MARLCRRPWRTSYFVGPDVQLGRDSPGKSLAGSLLVVMTTASEGVVLPVGGVILEPIPSMRVSSGENPVHLLDEQRRRFWRATLLKALLMETLLGQAVEGLPLAGRGGSVQVASLKGLPSSCGGDQRRAGDWGLPHVLSG